MIISIFEPALCCSTGICGPEPDSDLINLQQLQLLLTNNGVSVKRFAINQQPLAFTSEACVRVALKSEGPGILPLTVINGAIVKQGAYPSLDDLKVHLPELALVRAAPRILGQF